MKKLLTLCGCKKWLARHISTYTTREQTYSCIHEAPGWLERDGFPVFESLCVGPAMELEETKENKLT